LTETLDKVCQFYDKEVPAAIKRMFALFEPMMIVLMGVVVGGIALSIFLPMFQMAQLIGG
jgi:type IV pilus assembly protein PilC